MRQLFEFECLKMMLKPLFSKKLSLHHLSAATTEGVAFNQVLINSYQCMNSLIVACTALKHVVVYTPFISLTVIHVVVCQVLTGLVMNIAAISIVALCLNTYGVHVFDLKSGLPQWANGSSCTT